MSACNHEKYSTSSEPCENSSHEEECSVTKCDNCGADLGHDHGNPSNPMVGQQFHEIMTSNFNSTELRDIRAKHIADQVMKIGEDIFGGQSDEDRHSEEYARRLSRMRNFPEPMVGHDEEGLPEVQHKCSMCGLTHTWNGYGRINHGDQDTSGIMDYSKNDDEQDYAKGKFTPQDFFERVDNFHEAYGYDK